MVFFPPMTATTRFLPATMNLVDGSPRPPLSFLLRDAAGLIALFYVLRLSFFLVGVFGFVSAWHFALLLGIKNGADTVPVGLSSPDRWQAYGSGGIFMR